MAAFTVTVTAAASDTFPDVSLAVIVLTGATAAGGANLQVSAANGTFTPTFSNSRILGVNADDGTGGGLTLESNETNYNSGNDATNTFSASEWYYTGTVTSGVGFTVGATTSGTPVLAAYEVKASSGSTPLIDASSPAGVNNMTGSGSTALTTASFSPPAGSVLVALFAGNATGSGAVTITSITDTSGLGLTWTQRAIESPGSGPGGAFIWTTTMPGTPPVAATTPDAINPSPAWRGRFGPRAAKQQPRVLYDWPLIQEPFYHPPQTPDRAYPGPAFRGQFGQHASKSQPSVLYDGRIDQNIQLTAIVGQAFLEDVSNGLIVTGTITFNAIVGQASVEDFSNGLTIVAETTPYNQNHIQPGPAWRGQFGRMTAHLQPSVLYDYNPQVNQNIQLTAVAGQATVEDVSNDLAVSLGPNSAALAVAGQATIEDVSNGLVVSTSVSVVTAFAPDIALPGQAWQNQFAPYLTKQAVLYDYNAQVNANIFPTAIVAQAVLEDVSNGLIVALTTTETAVIGQATVNAPLLGIGYNDPDIAGPGPAWQNQFGHLSKNSVQFDFNPQVNQNIALTAIAAQAFVEDITNGLIVEPTGTPSACVGQATVNVPGIVTETTPYNPQQALISPAWRNQFGHLSKSSVEFDYNTQVNQNIALTAIIAQATLEDISNGLIADIIATPAAVAGQATLPTPAIQAATPYFDPDAASPGQAWRNYFGHLSRQAILYDLNAQVNQNIQLTAIVAQAFVEDVSNGLVVTITTTETAVIGQATLNVPLLGIGYNDPQSSLPGRAWRNQFGHLSKQSVLYDYNPQVNQNIVLTAVVGQAIVEDVSNGLVVSLQPFLTAIVGQATVEDVSNGLIVTTETTPYDPQIALPGQAWQNYFAGYLSKQSVLYDFNPQVNQNIQLTAIAGQATVEDVSNGLIAEPIATPNAVAGQATLPAPAISAQQVLISNDPSSALPGPAWRNIFRAYLSKQSVAFDYNQQVNANIFPAAIAAQATVEDASQGLVVIITATPTAVIGQATVESPLLGIGYNDPQQVLPGQAWRNYFGHLSKQSVLYDYNIQVNENIQLTAIAAQAFVEDISNGLIVEPTGTPNACAGQATVGTVAILTESTPYNPQSLLPSPAWRNQFGHLSKFSVEYDYNPQVNENLSIAAVTGQVFLEDVSNGLVTDITATPNAIAGQATLPAPFIQVATPITDPDAALPGQAWRNAFGHLTKQSVLYDFNPQVNQNILATAVAGQAVIEDVSNGLIVEAEPAITAIVGQATVEDVSNGLVVEAEPTETAVPGQATLLTPSLMTETTPYNPQASLPGQAWRNRFGHLSKQVVLYDFQPFASVYPAAIVANAIIEVPVLPVILTAVSGQATVEDASNGLTITATTPVVVIAGQATVPFPTITLDPAPSAVTGAATLPAPAISSGPTLLTMTAVVGQAELPSVSITAITVNALDAGYIQAIAAPPLLQAQQTGFPFNAVLLAESEDA